MEVMNMKNILFVFVFFSLTTLIFAQMKAGGGWTVETPTDEFGDPNGAPYYQKLPRGTFTTDIMERTGSGVVYCQVFNAKDAGSSQHVFALMISDGSEPLTFFLPSKNQFTLAIKDNTIGKTYRFSPFSIQGNRMFLFELTGDLATLLHGSHDMQFALSRNVSNNPATVVGRFAMTGGLPNAGL
jgi:hypothetical protein